jgi:hypothetical protein
MADNTLMANVGYEELLAYLDAPDSGFRRVTLPYTGGLDMIIYQ